jgi:hypothetical protein
MRDPSRDATERFVERRLGVRAQAVGRLAGDRDLARRVVRAALRRRLHAAAGAAEPIPAGQLTVTDSVCSSDAPEPQPWL